MLFKGFQIAKTAVFVDEGILIPLCPGFLSHDTHFRNKLYVNLDSLAGILHFLIGFSHVLWIWQFCRQMISFAEKTV